MLEDKKSKDVLKKVNILLLSETLIFIFSIMRRVWIYQTLHGLSRIRVYGMAFLIGMFAFTIILILRHFKHYAVKWYLVEFASVIAVVFLSFFFDTDKLIATRFRPTVNDEVDYGYISRLSPDAVDGWVEAYNQARGVLLNPDFATRDHFSDDEARHIIYSSQIIADLTQKTNYLSQKYDGVNLTSTGILSPEAKRYNFAEADAYAQLKKALPANELLLLKEKGNFYQQNIVEKKQVVPLDRSRQTPLVK
jgi:hypothetical protein